MSRNGMQSNPKVIYDALLSQQLFTLWITSSDTVIYIIQDMLKNSKTKWFMADE